MATKARLTLSITELILQRMLSVSKLKCSEEELKAFEQEILSKVQDGDVDRTVFEEFCTNLVYLLNCFISSASTIKLYSTS